MDGLGGGVMVLKSGGEGWSSGAIIVFFFPGLIAIQGMSKFGQHLPPLLLNLCGDGSRGWRLGDGVSGRR